MDLTSAALYSENVRYETNDIRTTTSRRGNSQQYRTSQEPMNQAARVVIRKNNKMYLIGMHERKTTLRRSVTFGYDNDDKTTKQRATIRCFRIYLS